MEYITIKQHTLKHRNQAFFLIKADSNNPMSRIFTCLLLFIFSFSLCTLHSQDYMIHVQQFGLKEGLAHRNVQNFLKDSHGFLWLITDYSLQRYDGYEFKSYPWINKNKHSLQLRHLGETTDGWLWVMGHEGVDHTYDLFFIHPKTGELRTAKEKLGTERTLALDSLLKSKKYTFYTSTAHSKLYYLNNKEIVIFDFEKGIQKINLLNLSENGIFVIKLIDHQGNYWIQDDISKKLYRYLVKEQKIERINALLINHSVYEWEEQIYLKEDKNRLSPNTETKILKVDSNGELEIQLHEPKELSAQFIVGGKIWCINDEGWKILDLKGNLLHQLSKEDYGVELFGNMNYKKLQSDENGKFYLNTLFGFNIITIKENPFTNYFTKNNSSPLPFNNAARGIHVSNDSIIVNFEYGGLVYLNKKNPKQYEVISKFCHHKDQSEGYSAVSLFRDRQGNYWTNHTSQCFQSKWSSNFSTEEKINFPTSLQNQYEVSWSIWEDDIGCIWASYNFGLRQTCPEDTVQTFFSFKDLSIPFDNFIIYQIQEGRDKNLWLYSERGIFVLDKNSKQLIHHYHDQGQGEYFLPSNEIFHMHLDQEGNRWLGTRNGLLFWDSQTNKKRLFNRNDGLSNDVIYAVYEDRNNTLWLSSDYGIMSFDKETFDIQTYLPKDGIPHEEFNRISHFQEDDGTIYFGGLNGVTAFHPDQFSNKKKRYSKTLLSECIIFGSKEDRELDQMKKVLETNTITLQPSDRYVKIKFTLPTFGDIHKVLYAWKIEGVFDSWNYQKENSLQFGTLPYGKHLLRVKGQTGSNGWSPHELTIQVHVLKPFYLQFWFILLSLFILLSSLIFFFRWRTQRLRRIQEILEEKVNQATLQIKNDKELIEEQAIELMQLDKAKSRFFANISHELRTPLTLILGPLSSIQNSGNLDKRNLRLIEIANQSGQELLKLIGSILDLSKMDSGKVELYEQSEAFFPLLQRIVLPFASMAQSKDILFEFNYEAKKDLFLDLDKNKLEVILNNLLSNAMKFTKSKDAVILTVKDIETEILFKVEDTGRGIHLEDQPHIFDRFYQSKVADAPIEGGTGIGLALTKEFVGIMKGKIWLKSTFGEGSTFFIELPKKESRTSASAKETLNLDDLVSLPDLINLQKLPPKQEILDRDLPTILVTEDNDALRDYMVSILSPRYNVLTARHGLMALDILEKNPNCQLITTDIMMPEMDGFQLLQILKSTDAYRHIPVIMLTARVDIKDKLHALRIGVNDYMTKPFDGEELLARIDNLLKNEATRK